MAREKGQLCCRHPSGDALIFASSRGRHFTTLSQKQFHVSNEWLGLCPGGILSAQHPSYIIGPKSLLQRTQKSPVFHVALNSI